MKLHYGHMNELANNKRNEYKGWTYLKDGSKNRIIVNKVTKQEIEILGVIADISRAIHIDQSHLTKLLLGKRQSVGDWEVKNRVIFPRPPKGKVYYLTSPEGKKVKVNNLEKFARDNGLSEHSLRDIIKGDKLEHKGWIAYGMTQENINNIKKENKKKRYENRSMKHQVIDSNGNLILIHNLSKFCRENKFDYKVFERIVKNERIEPYQGYRGTKITDEMIKEKSKIYILQNPEEELVEIESICKFCKNNDFTISVVYDLINGTRETYRGWRRKEV